MPKHCNSHKHSKSTKKEILLVCEEKSALDIPPTFPLVKDWKISFMFAEGSDLQPFEFSATGLMNMGKGRYIQSIATTFAALDRPPTRQDLDESKIILPVEALAGSITGQVLFLGEDNENYSASLRPYTVVSGSVVTLLTECRDNVCVQNPDGVTDGIQIVFVARLFFTKCKQLKCCTKKTHCW